MNSKPFASKLFSFDALSIPPIAVRSHCAASVRCHVRLWMPGRPVTVVDASRVGPFEAVQLVCLKSDPHVPESGVVRVNVRRRPILHEIVFLRRVRGQQVASVSHTSMFALVPRLVVAVNTNAILAISVFMPTRAIVHFATWVVFVARWRW